MPTSDHLHLTDLFCEFCDIQVVTWKMNWSTRHTTANTCKGKWNCSCWKCLTRFWMSLHLIENFSDTASFAYFSNGMPASVCILTAGDDVKASEHAFWHSALVLY